VRCGKRAFVATLKVVVAILAVPICAAACAYVLFATLCNHALINTRAFDFVCGHNGGGPFFLSLLIFLVLFALLAKWILQRNRRESAPSSNN
jgi:hypothetical protein